MNIKIEARSKFDLKDVSFLIIIRLDSLERLENLLCVIKYLQRIADTNICLLECDRRPNPILQRLLPKRNLQYIYYKDEDPILYRTRRLNQALDAIETPFVSIWDADIIIPGSQICTSVEYLREEKFDFVYPYKHLFLDVPMVIKELFFKQMKIDTLLKHIDKMPQLYQPNPCGGAFLCNMKSYKEVGFENEQFYGWGVEDGERYARWKCLGYRVEQIGGPLFHLSHPRGVNSTDHFHGQIVQNLKLKLLFKAQNLTKMGRK